MNYFFWGLLLAAAVVVFVSPIRIWVDYRHRGKTEDTLLVQVGILWGLGRFSLNVPVISASPRGVALEAEAGKRKKRLGLSISQIPAQVRVLSRLRGGAQKILRMFRRRIKIRRFVWHTEVGIWDSARLAQLSGALWAVKGMVSAGLQSWFKFSNPPVFRVIPQFQRSYFRTVFTCILEFPLGYAIIATFLAVCMMLKLKLTKRGDVNVRTSHPRPDENSHGKHQRNGGCQYGNR